jgi:N-acetylglucosaminyl-diphospho-decaprenol L-rhamnosyltransferase
MTSTAVIIVTHRTPALTAAAARSALDAGADQVVVVDNASGDDTTDRLHAFADDRLTVLQRSVNSGYGTAANAGATAAADQTLIFLNSDATLSTEAALMLCTAVQANGGRCIAGARLVGTAGQVQASAGLLPRPSDLIVRALGLHRPAMSVARLPVIRRLVSRSSLARDYASAAHAQQSMDTSMVSGACFAIGREAFRELGGFDERFFLYFEDADLCRRASAAGMAIRYVPEAVVTHIGGGSSVEDYHFGPHHARSMRQYLGKWYGPAGSVLAIILVWLRAIGFSITLRPGAGRAWRALLAAVRDEDPRRR